MTVQSRLLNVTIVASKRYIIVSDEPFNVCAIRPDGDEADIINVQKSTNSCGKHMTIFETVVDAVVYINGNEVTL